MHTLRHLRGHIVYQVALIDVTLRKREQWTRVPWSQKFQIVKWLNSSTWSSTYYLDIVARLIGYCGPLTVVPYSRLDHETQGRVAFSSGPRVVDEHPNDRAMNMVPEMPTSINCNRL